MMTGSAGTQRNRISHLVRAVAGAGAAPSIRRLRTLAVLSSLVAVAGCGSVESLGSKIDPIWGVSTSPRVVAEGDPVPRGGGGYKVGKPYTIGGRTYFPAENPNYVAEGQASWYGKDFHGRKTANGEIFDMASISAAHKTLPMPSYVRVTNLSNDRSIVVRVNNRGPYVGDRLIDVSYKTAELLGFAKNGVARVRVQYLGRAPLDDDDDIKLASTLRTDGTPADLIEGSPVRVASAKPFVPEGPSIRSVAAAAVPTGEAPVPPSRPYDLGQAGSSGQVVASAGWSQGSAPVSGLGFAGVPGER